MNRNTLSIALLIALSCAVALADDPAPWTPVDWQTLPKANPDDQIQLLYVRAPLLEDDLNDLLAIFKLYHGAIAFTNLRTNFSITINYDAFDFFRASLFPEFVTYPNGTKDLKWDNGGAVFVYLGINTTYWVSEMTKTAIITGDIYNQFLSEWNSQVNVTQPYYNMFGIVDASGKDFVSSFDCFDFVWEALATLEKLGVKFANNSLSRDYTDYIAVSAPVRVTELYNTDPNVRQDIIDFYEILDANLQVLTWEQIVWTLVEVLEGKFYLRVNTDYYELQLAWPLFSVRYTLSPFGTGAQTHSLPPPLVHSKQTLKLKKPMKLA